jgi:N-acetyl-gamma-glutamyl-phosphate/LysW-gamma-L-alpha-aminoadipyl-6-phosphate reductase
MTHLCASIVGASGYAGGELLRLLLDHPQIEIGQITSESNTGKYAYALHPNLRKRTAIKFVSAATLEPCDVLFLALPHGEAMKRIETLARLAPRIVDLSADFRLQAPADYVKWYGHEHTAPDWLPRFAYGLPELNRDAIRLASYVSGVGCNATAANLAVWPLFRADLADRSRGVIVEVKAGSSEAGAEPGPSSHHPDRSHVVRSFAPTGHRHTAEVVQALRRHAVGALLAAPTPQVPVHMSVTSVELVRGVLATAHVFCRPELVGQIALKDLWRAYRDAYGDEPFVRLVREQQGVYRFPEPKILAGSNYADVGFDLDPETGRIVAIAAIDNLMKGAAGTAVQCMNLMCGFDEAAGLGFPGLHPV